jgi:tetratricopeptide (TPR) repeat protein
MKQAFSIIEVAAVVGITPEVARALVSLVFGQPRDVLSVSELEVLREAHGLVQQRSAARARIVQTLGEVRAELPVEQPLSAVTLVREEEGIVIGHGSRRWNAESGQALLDLGPSPSPAVSQVGARGDAEALFAHASALEASDLEAALTTYSEALAANPHHADAHVNFGRLLHQRGQLREAEAHYVAALVSRPGDGTATFNLAVVLEDLGRADEAITRYREAIELDPHCVDAYFNLSRLYERKGEKLAALRHLKDYKRLSGN